MFVRASSVDEGLYRKVLLRVSELDSPVVQPTVQAKRRKLEQEMSTPARETEHIPRSLESSFANAANPERSPLDYVKAELAENVQLKKFYYRVRKRSWSRQPPKMKRSLLSQPYDQGSVEIVTNLVIQNRNVFHLPVLLMTLVV